MDINGEALGPSLEMFNKCSAVIIENYVNPMENRNPCFKLGFFGFASSENGFI